MLLRKIVPDRKSATLLTSFITNLLSVKMAGKSFLVMSNMATIIDCIITDIITTTRTENFAAFGRPAPSSFETLTLAN